MAPILKNAPFENAFPVYAVTLVLHSSSSTPRYLCLFHDFELCVFLVLLWQAEHCALHHLTRYLECHMWPDSVKLKDSACFSVTIYPDKLERKLLCTFFCFTVVVHKVNTYLLKHFSVFREGLVRWTQTCTVRWRVRPSQWGDGCWEGGKELLVKGLCLMCFKGNTMHRLAACGKTKSVQESFTDID